MKMSAACERWLNETLSVAPPLTSAQRAKLAELLRPAREHIMADRLASRPTKRRAAPRARRRVA